MKKFLFAVVLASTVGMVSAALFLFGTLDGAEDSLRDRFFVGRSAPDDIIIIAIDEKSLADIGRWPWDRAVHARLLEMLAGANPRVVGLDIHFSEPQDEANDGALERALKKLPAVVLPVEVSGLELGTARAEGTGMATPLKRFVASNVLLGHVNVPVDDDGIARRVPLDIGTGQFPGSIPAFAFALAQQASGDIPSLDLPYVRRIQYLGSPGTIQTISYADVLNATVPAETFRNKIVLIGATATDLRDTLVTPTSRGRAMSGVEVHAHILEMIRRGDFLSDAPVSVAILFILLPAIVLGALISRLKNLVAIICMTFAFLIAVAVVSAVAFDQEYVLPIVYPPLALFGAFAVTTAFHYTSEAKEKRWIRSTFQQYVSPQVIEALIADPSKLRLGGEKREISVLFSDIRGFTTWSEQLTPDELVPLLNEYLSALTEVVLEEGGVLDKYIGDAIMAFWGAPLEQPDHALRAVRAAVGMREALEDLNADWVRRGIAPLKNGVGIATGEVIIGNMGSHKRFDYTIIGDTVNTASRLESATKELGEYLVFSQTTAEKIKNTLPIRALGEIAVKGKTKPVKVFTLE